MKVLIVSDTHGRNGNFYQVLTQEKDLGLIIHLGDIDSLEGNIEKASGVPCYAVKGNNDYYSSLPSESVIMLGSHRTFITHGHNFGVSYTNANLRHYAEGLDCDYALYGHTHFPEIEKYGRLTLVNPGSLTYPRQPGRKPSYCVAMVNDDGSVDFEIKYLD